MRRRPGGALPEIRRKLADHYRGCLEMFGHRHKFEDGAVFSSPWPRMIEALEAGESVDVYGWEICKYRPGIDSQTRYRVHADGTVVPLPRDE